MPLDWTARLLDLIGHLAGSAWTQGDDAADAVTAAFLLTRPEGPTSRFACALLRDAATIAWG